MTFSAGALLAAGWMAQAAPLQRADLPAEPAWVLHLDCDGLRGTVIGQHILSEMSKPEAEAKLAAFQSIFSVDLRTQLHGFTLYSTGTAPEDGVLIVYADFDPGRLVVLAKAANDYQSLNHNQHVIHNWIDEKKPAKNGVKPRVYAAIEGTRIVFGQREATVAKALDVLDRTAPNLASTQNFAQLGAVGSTSYIQLAAHKLDLAAGDPNAAIFRLAKAVALDVGEVQQQVTATLRLDANDEEIAGHMLSIGQGLVSLMKLQTEKPETVKFAEAITLKKDGAAVTAHLSLSAPQMVEWMKADAARKAQQKAEKN
jgi:hypothetical protein